MKRVNEYADLVKAYKDVSIELESSRVVAGILVTDHNASTGKDVRAPGPRTRLRRGWMHLKPALRCALARLFPAQLEAGVARARCCPRHGSNSLLCAKMQTFEEAALILEAYLDGPEVDVDIVLCDVRLVFVLCNLPAEHRAALKGWGAA